MKNDLRNKITDILNGSTREPIIFIFDSKLKEFIEGDWVPTNKQPAKNDLIICYDNVQTKYDCLHVKPASIETTEAHLRRCHLSESEILRQLSQIDKLEDFAGLLMHLKK